MGSFSADASNRDRRLGLLAASQHGVVARDQLLELGFSDDLISERLERSLWPVAYCVYAVGHPGLSRRGRAAAALLHAGDGAGLSHWSSARVWGMVGRSLEGDIHVSVPDRRVLVPVDGVVIHRPRNLKRVEIVEHRGIRLATPERTLVDLLPETSAAQAAGMLEQMVTHLNRSPDDLHTWGHSLHGVRGKPKLLRALDDIAGPAVIRSEFEALFREVCREGGLPTPLTNHYIGRNEVDAVYVKERVAVELDSWRWHGGRWQFHQDRRKGLAISRAGFELIRLTWPQLKYERAEVIEALRYALARGASRGLADRR